MRAAILVMVLLLPAARPAAADIIATCYTDCEAETDSNPDFKACLSRAANKADRCSIKVTNLSRTRSARRPRR